VWGWKPACNLGVAAAELMSNRQGSQDALTLHRLTGSGFRTMTSGNADYEMASIMEAISR
jgi:hypothetical protein